MSRKQIFATKATVVVSDWLPAVINKSTEADVAVTQHQNTHFLADRFFDPPKKEEEKREPNRLQFSLVCTLIDNR